MASYGPSGNSNPAQRLGIRNTNGEFVPLRLRVMPVMFGDKDICLLQRYGPQF
jgi:hypothetical protein